MDTVKPETLAAIKGDEFARTSLEYVRALIFAHFRDWDRINRSGKIPFTDDNAATCYACLCVLLDTTSTPDIGDLKVNISGQRVSASALQALQDVFAESHP